MHLASCGVRNLLLSPSLRVIQYDSAIVMSSVPVALPRAYARIVAAPCRVFA